MLEKTSAKSFLHSTLDTRLRTVSNRLFLLFLRLLIIRFSSIVTESSISTLTEAQQCINHGIINRNIVKAQVKHRRHADMNTHFDWAGTRRQRTFQLAEGTIPRLALRRSPDTGWVFAVINSPRVRTAAMCFHCACLIFFFHFF